MIIFALQFYITKTIDMKNIEKEVCEPAVSYTVNPSVGNARIESNVKKNVPKDCMTVDEYIGKIKKALDMRYENI